MNTASWRKLRRRGGLIAANSLNSLAQPFLNILISLAVVRLAGVELWGGFVDALIIVQLAAMIVGWGNKEYLMRTASRQPTALTKAWRTSFMTRMLLLLPVPLALALLGWSPQQYVLGLVWTIALALAQSFEMLILYRRAFVFALIVEIATTGLVLLAINAVGPTISVIQLMLMFTVAAVIKTIVYGLRFRADILGRLENQDGWRAYVQPAFFRAAFPFFLLGFSGMMQSRIDLYSVSYFLSPTDVGTYQVYINLLLYVQSLAAFVLIPFTKSLYRLDYDAIGRISNRLFIFGFVLMWPMLVGLYGILTYLYHITLSPGFYVLAVFYVLPIFYYLPTIYALYKAEQQGVVVRVNIAGLTANLALNVILLPRIGLIGAILSTVIVRGAVSVFYHFQGRKLRREHAPAMS
ncbi:MAG: polysaccharide biosynthesis C-terminal domain-containing protein [Caldilineales bacterium]|nr:polysaccharide biosynthesis C-terminal domain-containing protein [Caldilineales bacterium]